ncbi:hypothetical protein PFLUV_G00232090 [Perca fluviatilis]|uniref:Uncharacterized protein n=1 Tax=Perca fluviatilis TaxID=8168 RepID=A0A6A5DY15_PERFL|nr:hypothetical protein PFLUV_G00232090 [Perca fluviatilis]
MKRFARFTALQAKTQTGNSFIIMHQRLVVVTSYLRQAEGTGSGRREGIATNKKEIRSTLSPEPFFAED